MELPTGTKLPNGAVVMEECEGIILAKQDKARGPEYVTWRWDGTNPDSTYWGQYFDRLADAAANFTHRVDRQLGRVGEQVLTPYQAGEA